MWNGSNLISTGFGASQIRWWVDGEWITDYDGLDSNSSSEVDRDEHWSVQVIPGDGEASWDLNEDQLRVSKMLDQ